MDQIDSERDGEVEVEQVSCNVPEQREGDSEGCHNPQRPIEIRFLTDEIQGD